MTRARPIIAIDGPVGAGKSVAARALARKLGFSYLNTGAMYRAVAIAAREAGVSPDGASVEKKLAPILAAIKIAFDGSDDHRRSLARDELGRARPARAWRPIVGVAKPRPRIAVRRFAIPADNLIGKPGLVLFSLFRRKAPIARWLRGIRIRAWPEQRCGWNLHDDKHALLWSRRQT